MLKKWYNGNKGLFIFGVLFIIGIIVIIVLRANGVEGV